MSEETDLENNRRVDEYLAYSTEEAANLKKAKQDSEEVILEMLKETVGKVKDDMEV